MNFGNFTVQQLPRETRIDYKKTAKDWFDIFLALILGLATSGFIGLMYIHTHFNKPIFWIVAICFAFFALFKLSDGILRLAQSSKSVIVILKDKKTLAARYTTWKSISIGFDNISSIELKGKNVATYAKGSTRYQIYMAIQIVTKDGKLVPLVNINPTQVFSTSTKETETNEYKIGQGLAKLLADETGVHYNYAGFERTNG